MDLRKARSGLLCILGLCVAAASALGQHTNITGFADINGGQHLYYLDSSSHLNQLYYLAGTTWLPQDLTGLYKGNTPGADSPLTSNFDDVNLIQSVYYVDSNQHLNRLYYSGGNSWTPEDITASTGGPKTSTTSLASFYDGYTDEQHVFYLDANGHVNQAFSVAGGPWVNQDLTAFTNSSGAASGSALAAFVDFSQGQHVVYLDSNNHLNQIFYDGTAWYAQDLTALYGGNTPASTSNLSAYIDATAANGQHIVYEDGNQHLNQVFYNGGSTWYTQDLTTTQGGNMPEVGSHLATYIDGNGLQHIAYLDGSQHVNQMFYPGSGPSWFAQDLTAQYGGNTAGAGSTLVAFPLLYDPGSIGQHIAYLDGSDNVNQIFYPASGGSLWYPQNLTAIYGGNAPALRPVSGQD